MKCTSDFRKEAVVNLAFPDLHGLRLQSLYIQTKKANNRKWN